MTNSDFQVHLRELRTVVEAALTEKLTGVNWPESLKSAVEYSLMAGGKRLRPLLVLLANDVCGGQLEEAIPAACAVEMIHTYSLIHDDLPSMDDDDFRRGRPTSHKLFGEALAILAGDGLLTLAFETIASAPIDPGRIVRLTRSLAAAAGGAGMVGGQVLDMEAERGALARAESGKPKAEIAGDLRLNARGNAVEQSANSANSADSSRDRTGEQATSQNSGRINSNQTDNTRVEELSRIHKMKTGALIAGALEMGSICACSDGNSTRRLRRYGDCIGLAFQIADDLLDVTGDQTKLGKTPGRDADLGKLTYPGLLGIENSRARAEQLVQEACDALDIFGERSRWLKELARFIVERDH